MAFALADGIITQTGIDTDLSGLAGIAGVQTIASGTYTWYYTNNLNLHIDGDLTIDPEIECLVMSDNDSLDIRSGGTLNFGVVSVIQGADRYSLAVGLVHSETNRTVGAFDVDSGGTLNWNGGGMVFAGGMEFLPGSTVTINNGFIVGQMTASARIRQYSTALNVDGFRTTGDIRFDIFASPVTFNGYDAGYKERGTFQAISAKGGGGSNDIYVVRDFDGAGLLYIGDAFGDRKVEFYNLAYSGNFDVTHQSRDFDPATTCYKEAQLAVTDAAGVPVQNCAYWMTDYDNGLRPVGDRTWRGQADESFELTRIYSGSTDTSGLASLTVLTRISYDGFSPNGVADGTNVIDHRSQNNDNTDTFPTELAHYNHHLSSTSNEWNGSGVKTIPVALMADTLVTEPTKATVDAYDTIDTPAQLYDAAKAFLVDNWGTHLDLIVGTNTGDVGALNVVVDATAAAAFAYNGTDTITIRTSTFTGDLITTGLVTLANGATVVGIVSDSTGTTGILELT